MMPPKQPKITQKLLLRTALGIFALAALVLAFNWYKGRESDPSGDSVLDTKGWVSAIETVGDGRHAVAFKSDGTIVRQPNPPADSEDQHIAWRPDGNFIFFASNRVKGKFTMFRWHPDGGSAEIRSMQGLAQGSPFFLASDAELGADANALITASGQVMQYDPKKQTVRQVLPPPDPNSRAQNDAEGGSRVSPFEGMYDRFGTSFRVAKWSPDKKGVYAVMRRETGEILIYQKLDYATPAEGKPRAVIAGDRIDFDIDQQKGIVYFSVENFQWPFPEDAPPTFIKNGRVTTPYKHGIGILDISSPTPMQMIVVSKDDNLCFGELTLAPAGDKLAVIGGVYTGSGNLTAKGLLVLPPQPNLPQLAPPVVLGEVYEPAWSPDGKKIAYARRESATSRPIYVLEEGSSTPHRLSSENGVFGFPVFSPKQ